MSSEIGASGDLFETIFQIFSSFCKELPTLNPSATRKQQIRCQEELERLFLWADSFSIQDGYLDNILSQSSALRSSVLLMLLDMGKTVCQDLFTCMGHNKDFNTKFDHERRSALNLLGRVHTALQQDDPKGSYFERAESYNGDDLEADLDDVLDNITTLNDCLMDLSLALEDPVIDPDQTHLETSDPAEPFNVSQPALVYCRKIRDRFPRLPLYLVERLGNANLQRANMLRQIRNHVQTTNESSHFVEESLFSKSIPQITDTTKSTITQDSIFSRDILRQKDDTDLETSSQASYASYSTSNSMYQGRPRVPPLPEQAASGGAFECEYCAKTIDGVFTRRQWK